jgi:hypothetical protein
MANFALYIDDSGHPDNQPFVVAAGFVSTEQQWTTFEPLWKDALSRHRIIEPFHMTDFMRERRPIKERSLILQNLANIITNHAHAAFTGAVDMNAYRLINEEYALQECLGAPYALASRGLAIGLNQWRSKYLDPTDQLQLFTESGAKHRGDMLEVFKRDRLPEPQSVPKSLAFVQPADMLAWEMFNFLRTKKQPRRVLRLIGGNVQFGSLFGVSDLRETCVTADVPLRSTLRPGDTFSFASNRKRLRKKSI